ncbi:MAG: LexA family protein [Coprobacillaceae bacterium]
MKYYEKLKKLRNQTNLSQQKTADLLGMPQTTYSKYENGTRQPDIEIQNLLANYFNVDLNYIFSEKTHLSPIELAEDDEVIGVPLKVIGVGGCGNGKNNDDYISDELFFVPKQWIKGETDKYFFAYASGDSMIDAHIIDGAILLFKEQPLVDTNEIGAFYLNGETYIKRYKELDNCTIVLQSENRLYDPIIVTSDDDFRVIAKLMRINIVVAR